MRKACLFVLAILVSTVVACSSTHPEHYTNVTAPTSAGKTVTGKVVSFTDDTVTIETVTGRETLGMTPSTHGRDLLVVGSHLAFAIEHGTGRGEPVVTLITANPSEPEPHG